MKDNVNLNERSSASQKALILAHLKARIADIKADGVEVKSEFVKLPNGKQVKRYFL